MELSVVHSRALAGIEAPPVRVETHLSNGLPCFNIVGLPETAVRESRDRVRSALINSGFQFPDRRITVNLAPADLPKEGGGFDLPIAVGILQASGQLHGHGMEHHEFLAELALDARLHAAPGAISAALAATRSGRALVLSPDCAGIAARVPHSRVIPAPDLLTLCAHLNGAKTIRPAAVQEVENQARYADLDSITGQYTARRALEIAASGGHNLLLCGPPGTGKTLLASRLPGLLPPLSEEESLTAMALRSCFRRLPERLGDQRPFRNPHHSASAVAMVGGGSRPRPGEISLAHGGVLFLDELPEFSRHTLEVLREPLEAGEITIARAAGTIRYPARFLLVAAMNPCKCGHYGDSDHPCRCTPEQIQKYRARVSGPLLDRIDLYVTVNRPRAEDLLASSPAPVESSATVRARVLASRELQMSRQGCVNAALPHDGLARLCRLPESERAYLEQAVQRQTLSARGLHRVMRVARTLADLEGRDGVTRGHLEEALAFRDAGAT